MWPLRPEPAPAHPGATSSPAAELRAAPARARRSAAAGKRRRETAMRTLRKLPPMWRRARTGVLSAAGFAGLTASAWTALGTPAGLAAGGLSCLLLEYLSGDGSS